MQLVAYLLQSKICNFCLKQAMSKADDIVAAATEADLLASTGVSRYVFETTFRNYCGMGTPIQTRFVLEVAEIKH